MLKKQCRVTGKERSRRETEGRSADDVVLAEIRRLKTEQI